MHSEIKYLIFSFVSVVVLFTVGCSAQQSEEQALRSLREITSGGKLPAESVVADIESRFANKRTGALAKLLRARIRFEQKDFIGAAAILSSNDFRMRTKIADDALWLRAKALQSAGDHEGALKAADELLKDFPASTRRGDTRWLWAESAIQAGRAVEVPPFLVDLSERHAPYALLLTAKAYEAQGSQNESLQYYRRTYFYGAGSSSAKEAQAKLTTLSQSLEPQNAQEQTARAEMLLDAGKHAESADAFATLAKNFPEALTSPILLRRMTALVNAGRMTEAQSVFISLPVAAAEREEGFRRLALGYAKARSWPLVRSTIEAMRHAYPNGKLVAKTMIDAGLAARDAKNRAEEGYYLNTAHTAYPNAVEVAQAQFEAAWFQHEQGNFAISSQMLVDHLARYTHKDTSNRGKAGYWAARDSERAGKTSDACYLYEAVIYRYSANWYGYLAGQRFAAMKARSHCNGPVRDLPTSHSPLDNAIQNLRTVTVAPETAGPKELELVEKSEELTTIGLFDWAIDELNEAKKTAGNSPTINLALAKHHRMKGDNVNALLALAKSYPDFAQMFPEEMGREEWDIFYPHINWAEVKYWAGQRGLDVFLVAGLIRQESIFSPRVRSSANAYGLMQLLVPTAQSMARKYVARTSMVTADMLYQPPLNIELGTAYMKDQLEKFGRIEYMAVAYNAGPGRVPQWRARLPAEMDEFVEAIPFRETKGYVQGIIRNTAQYRRLYDEKGNFRSNVGTRPMRGELDTLPRDEFKAQFPEIQIDEGISE